MPHIRPDDAAALAAVLFALTWLGFWIDRQSFSSKLPGVPCVIAAGLVLSNLGVIPLEAPTYGFVGEYLLPLGVPFLLFKANLRNILRDGGWVLVAFVVASTGICLGAIVGFYVFELGEYGAKVAGTYAGAFIGGVVSFVAVSQAAGMTATQASVSLSASAPASILGLMALVSLPSFALLRRWMPSPVIAAAECVGTPAQAESSTAFRVDHIAAAIAISFAICAVSNLICTVFHLGHYNLLVITTLTLLLANLAPRQFARLQGDFLLGMLCMYVFFAVIGAGTDALGFVKSAPILFFYCSFILAVQFVLVIAVGRLFKIDLAEVVIGSGAAIVGAAAGAAIASGKGWRSLVTVAITMGMFGKAVGNFIGLAIYKLLA
jgi:uncharacterized membrane protein